MATKQSRRDTSSKLPQVDLATLARFIANRRTKLGLTQGKVASIVGKKSGEWLGMIESCARPIQIDDAPRLADALQLDRNYFCKLVLSQRHPTVFAALFPKEGSLQKMKDNPKESTGKVYTAQIAMDLYEKIQALPAASQVTVMNIIDQMFSMYTTNNRTGLPIQ